MAMGTRGGPGGSTTGALTDCHPPLGQLQMWGVVCASSDGYSFRQGFYFYQLPFNVLPVFPPTMPLVPEVYSGQSMMDPRPMGRLIHNLKTSLCNTFWLIFPLG